MKNKKYHYEWAIFTNNLVWGVKKLAQFKNRLDAVFSLDYYSRPYYGLGYGICEIRKVRVYQ